MERKLLRDVFVPGGLPTITYVPRTKFELENRLNDAISRLNKIVLVSGATKSGKTVLVKRAIAEEKSVWVEGGAIRNENDFWNELGLDGPDDLDRLQRRPKSPDRRRDSLSK